MTGRRSEGRNRAERAGAACGGTPTVASATLASFRNTGAGEGCGAGVLQDQAASAQLATSFSPSHSRDSLSFGSGKATFAVSDDRFKDSTTAWGGRERHSLNRVALPHESLAERCDEVLVRRSIARGPGGDGEPCRERPALPDLCVKHTRKPADPRSGDFRQLHGSVLVSTRETNQELVASDSISLASVALLAPDHDRGA